MHIRRKAHGVTHDAEHDQKKHHEHTTQPSSSTAQYQSGDEVEYISNTKQAVIWVRKAKNGSDNWTETCTKSQYAWYQVFKRTKFLNFCAKLLLCVLTLFELPSTCKGTEWQCAHANYNVYSWNLPVIPIRIRMVIALCLYLFIAFRLYARMKSLGEIFTSEVYKLFYGDEGERYAAIEYSGWYLFQAIVCALGTLTCIWTMISAAEGSFSWLITIMCRPLLLVGGTKKLRQAFCDIFKSIRGYAVVLAALLLSIWVFIWMGMILFARTPEGKSQFFSWADACASMWILFTTSNDPNQWIPAYSQSRWSVIFFAIFLIFTIYLLLSLLLAKVYQVYQDIQKDNLSSEQESTKEAIKKAFHALMPVDPTQEQTSPRTDIYLSEMNDGIDLNTWKEFVEELCQPYVGLIQCGDETASKHNHKRCIHFLKDLFENDGRHQRLSVKLDEFMISRDATMDEHLFQNIVAAIIERGMFIPTKKPKAQRHRTYACCPESFGNFFLNGADLWGFHFNWDSMVNCGIVAAMPITLWASVSYAYPTAIQPVEFRRYLSFQLLLALSCLYTFGITLKISSLGYERFWFRNKVQHRFDFFNVYILFIAEILFFTCLPLGSLARMVIILHIFRGFRLLAKFKSLQSLFTIIVRLIPMFWQMFLVLFVVYYIFAVIGQYWFGGMIYTTNPVLAGTNFASAGFWPLNFNDLPSGFITLFSLMVVNNWYEIAQGYMFVTYSNWAASYFVVFFVVINLIVLNIILALILDCTTAVEEIVDMEWGTTIRQQTLGNSDKDVENNKSSKSKYNASYEGEGMGMSLTASHVLRKALSGGDDVYDSEHEDHSDDESSPLSYHHGSTRSNIARSAPSRRLDLATESTRWDCCDSCLGARKDSDRSESSRRLDDSQYGTFHDSEKDLTRRTPKKRTMDVTFAKSLEGNEEPEGSPRPPDLPTARSVLTDGTNDLSEYSIISDSGDPSSGRHLIDDMP